MHKHKYEKLHLLVWKVFLVVQPQPCSYSVGGVRGFFQLFVPVVSREADIAWINN